MTSNMESSSQQKETQAASARRARISYACEACRAAKVKCQPSVQAGICRRCSDSKRECVFKTGPRTRRPRKQHPSSSTPSTPRPTAPPPPGPSKTFTIDIPMQDEFEDLATNLEDLRLSHEMHVADLLPEDDEYASYSEYTDDDEEEGASSSQHRTGSIAGASSAASHASSLPVGASALSTPPSSISLGKSVPGRRKGPLASLGVRPQFNLDSAEKLLLEFETRMLLHFPAVAPSPVLHEEGGDVADEGRAFSVQHLAKTRPFVLLAILAAASGSRTLQGHSLYDDEFRKILGLKFVAGGERSLELLQGLVVYTAWYPFHLRPKNKQAFQYVRMVVDIVNDLELDQDPDGDEMLPAEKSSDERLEQTRTYLATYYLVSSFAAAWNRVPALFYTKYTAKCCDILERDSTIRGDHILAWHIRIQHILEEISQLRKTKVSGQNEYQISLMLKGIEHQLHEWESRMPPEVANTPSIRLTLLFTKIFIPAAPLLKLPMPKARPTNQNALDPITFVADNNSLRAVVPDIRAFFDEVLTFSSSELNSFSGTEWGRFILIVILAFRLSFPLVENPEWDYDWARRELQFGKYLKRFEDMGEEGEGQNMDVLNASKVVLGVVRKKWEKRAARMDRIKGKGKGVVGAGAELQGGGGPGGDIPFDLGMGDAMGMPGMGLDGMDPMVLDKTMQGCPMIDGSLESYYPLWDESFSSAGVGSMAGMFGDQSGAGDIGGVGGGGPPLPGDEYVDVWSTMTAGWAEWPQQGGGYEGGSS